jgi:hypothetical protein
LRTPLMPDSGFKCLRIYYYIVYTLNIMYRWLYIWSPRYEIFHHILRHCIKDISGIEVHPQFLPQSYFQRKAEGHHFTGNSTKLRLTLSALVKHPGETIIVSDVDLIVFDENNDFASYLSKYDMNDMTFMLDNYESEVYNIGFSLIKSTPNTINFVKNIVKRIDSENGHDQTIVNEELKNYTGPYGFFSIPEVVQSNMVNVADFLPHRIIQCLSSREDSDEIIAEKIISISMYFDISQYRHLLSQPIEELLINHSQTYDPLNIISTWTPSSQQTSSIASSHPHPPEPPHEPSSEPASSP